jgi:methionyl-tRNA formyltransferase
MRVAFFAADDFAIPLLRHLARRSILCCLVTQPDKPRGRGLKTSPLPIRSEAEKLGIDVLIDESLKSDKFRTGFASLKADIPIVAAFSLYIPKWIRNWNPFPCINVHPSILPGWRGADPVRRTIIEGDTKTGVTLHFTEKKMDTGDIIMMSPEMNIGQDITYLEMRDRLSFEAVTLVDNFLERLSGIELSELQDEDHPGKTAIRHLFNAYPQDDSKATFAGKLGKNELWIDWDRKAIEIHNLVRGLSPDPSARTGNPSNPLKILKTRFIEDPMASRLDSPGGILEAYGDILTVACGKDKIRLIEIQPAGRKALSAKDFLNGYRLKPGDNIRNFK